MFPPIVSIVNRQVYGGEGPSTPINKVSSDKTMPAPAALP